MARKYFGTDGIRGLANGEKLTPELAMKVGMAAGLKFVHGDHRNRVVIGKDTRRSGYMIESALTAGFTAVGMDVYLLGPMPTPAVAMLTRSLRADLGVMISASHNPFDDNGIKLFRPDGYKLSDAVENDIEELIDSDMSGVAVAGPRHRPGASRRGSPDPLHRIRQAHPAQGHRPSRPARGARLRQWRRLQGRADRPVGAGCRSLHHRRRARWLQHQRQGRLDRARGADRQGQGSCGPISASRSMATPTASSSSTRRARSSTATSSWP